MSHDWVKIGLQNYIEFEEKEDEVVEDGRKGTMIGSGTFEGYIIDSLNKKVPIKIKDVVFCPNLGVNLLSITKFLSDGGNLTSEGLKLVI